MAKDGKSSYPSLAYSNYTLALLWLIYVSNQWARYILNYLYAISSDSSKYSISTACDLSTSEYGLLTGYGFSGTFVITGLFMGRAADRYNRRNIIIAGCLIWNVALLGQGLSYSFWELLVFRLLLGFGEAFSCPASYSMVADMFPPEQRPTANGIFASAVYVGGGMASLSEAIAESIGWRLTMMGTAALGGAVAVAMLITVQEPPRQAALANASQRRRSDDGDGSKQQTAGQEASAVSAAAAAAPPPPPEPSVFETMAFLLTDPHTVLLLAAAAVRFCGGYAIAGYLPTFFEDKFPDDTTAYSYINAYVVAFGGFMSSFIGGKVCTAWLESRHGGSPWPGAAKANYYLPAVGFLVGIPFFLICLFASNFYVALLVGLLGEYLVAECWFGPYMAALQGAVPPSMRALAVATMMLVANFFGSLTSYVMGVVQDDYDTGYKSLTYILLVAVVGTYALSAALFLAASLVEPSPRADGGGGGGKRGPSQGKPHGGEVNERTSLLAGGFKPPVADEEAI